MEVILSYAPQIGFERVVNSETVLDTNNWLSMLIKKHFNKDYLEYLGRDELKRIELCVPLSVFETLKNDPLFIMKAETLRRLRTTRKDVLDYLMTSNINLIDNDLDDPKD
jgi:hypothetical protein